MENPHSAYASLEDHKRVNHLYRITFLNLTEVLIEWLSMYIECWLFWVYFREQWKENVETLIVDMQVFTVDILQCFIVKINGKSRRKPLAGKNLTL